MIKKQKKFDCKRILGNRKVLYILTGFVSLVVVFVTIQSSTMGAKLQYLEEKESKLENDTRMLEEDLARADSLSRISEEAGNLQFIEPQAIVYSQEAEDVGMNLR